MSLVWREALRAVRRAPLLAALSVTAIGFSLFSLGLFGLVALNLREGLRRIEERVEVVAYVLRGTPAETITAASQDIAAFPEVADVQFVSEDEALARARRELVEFRDAYRDLQVNPLPASLEIRLREGARETRHVAAVAERVKGFPFVEDVRYGRDWVERLDQLRNLLAVVGLGIGAAFAAVAAVIIGVTIRLTVLQRAREIAVMRVVGATNWFVRGPFLVEGVLKGLAGGLFAIVLTWGVFRLAGNTSLQALQGLVFFSPLQLAGLLVAGALLGLGASAASLARELRDA